MKVVQVEPGGFAEEAPRPEPALGLTETTADRPDTAPGTRERPLVLVVDDEESIRLLCGVNLRLEGMDTVEAGSGDEALEAARKLRPDLVLLDVMMPRVDGWQVAHELACDPSTCDLPIVFLSARAEPADYLHGYELGAVGYVTKPFDPTALGATLHHVLRLGRDEREALRRERMEALSGRARS